MMILSWN
nr:unnamed protein product [Callosobruchus analis]CAI5865597.1 unnamed protein product [Callosobruchus analis]